MVSTMKRSYSPRSNNWTRRNAPVPSPWRSRGYLPHFDEPGRVQTITFRLADSLPRNFLDRCEKELLSFPREKRQIEKEKRIGKMLDLGVGECHLRDPRAASVVEDALLFFDTERYNLLCWSIMPNHVHSMIETFDLNGLDAVLHSWKSYTSNEVNKVLGRRGTLWQREYHDRFIRDDDHYAKAFRYIEENPVKAGLVARAEDWRWSSAWKGWQDRLFEVTDSAGSTGVQGARGLSANDCVGSSRAF